MVNRAEAQIDPVPCDPEEQARIFDAQMVRSVIGTAIDAYYRQHRQMPANFNQLRESGYLFLGAGNNLPLKIVEKPLGDAESDFDKIGFTFTQAGFGCNVYMPWGTPDNPDGMYLWNLGDDYNAFNLENYYSSFENPSSVFTDSNPAHARLSHMNILCDQLVMFYWLNHKQIPENISQLLDGKWTPDSDVIGKLPVYDSGSPGWFYFGVVPDSGLTYCERVYSNTAPVVNQKVYKEDDPLAMQENVVGRKVCVSEAVTRDQTIPIIDSSIHGWGFLTD
ncbi:MAG TPA: hypothetical protein ENN67_04545 [Firmicutes bacterium]|nr:hypothetical protein [Bacillota bacterium]